MSGMYGKVTVADSVFSDPQTNPVFSWKGFAPYFAPAAASYRQFIRRGGEQDQLYNQYKDAYLGGSDEAAANARVYQDYARGLFSNQPNQMGNYRDVGDYLYGKFDDFRNTTAASGNRDMNSRLALLGIRPGSTGYDRLLNANRITNNLAPAFANTTNAIGRDYNAINSNSFQDTMLRLGLANNDALGGYMDRVYERPLDVANTRWGQIGNNIGGFNALSNAFNSNVAGYQTREGSDVAKYLRPLDENVSSYSGGSYGGGGGGSTGPQTSQQFTRPQMNNQNPYMNQMGQNPYQMPQGGYPQYGNTGGYMPPAQNQAWMNEFNGGGVPAYQGDVNVGASTAYTA